MYKKVIKSFAILFIILALYNVAVFLLFEDRTNLFWISYGFTLFAFLAQAVVCIVNAIRGELIKNRFLHFPILYIGFTYVVLQIIISSIIMLFLTEYVTPNMAIVIYAFLLGISAIFILAADLGIDEIKRVENNIAPKVFYIKSLQGRAENLASKVEDGEVNKSFLSLAEALKYSDPSSHGSLESIETDIEEQISWFDNADLKNKDETISKIENVIKLLEERNRQCKLLK